MKHQLIKFNADIPGVSTFVRAECVELNRAEDTDLKHVTVQSPAGGRFAIFGKTVVIATGMAWDEPDLILGS